MAVRGDGKRYAEDTRVPVSKTAGEIKALVMRAGAEEWMQGERGDQVVIQFRLRNRVLRFRLYLTDANDREVRRRWRALQHVMKSKFLNWEEEIETFDEAFLPNIVTGSGDTIADVLEGVLEDGKLDAARLPSLIPDAPGPLRLPARAGPGR